MDTLMLLYKLAFLIAITIAFIGGIYEGLWILIHKKPTPIMRFYWRYFGWIYFGWRYFGYGWIEEWIEKRPIFIGLCIIFWVLACFICFIWWWFSGGWRAFVR